MHKRLNFLFRIAQRCLLPLILLTQGCDTSTAQVSNMAYQKMLNALLDHSVPECSPREAEKTPHVLFLDAREDKEYKVSHLTGALPVGYDHFSLEGLQDIPKDTPVVVYCSVGYRSEKVTEKLLAAGYTNVRNMVGGIFEWVNEGKPVVNDKGPTQQVHAYNKKWGVWLQKGEKVY